MEMSCCHIEKLVREGTRMKRGRLERRRSAAGGMGEMGSRRGTAAERWWRRCKRGTEGRAREGWCGRGMDQKGENWRCSYGAGFPTRRRGSPKWLPPSATGQRPPYPMARRQAAPQEQEQDPPLPHPSPQPRVWVLGDGSALPGPDLPGRSPQDAWCGRVPPGCLAAPKGKWDCKELRLCGLVWSSWIPANLGYIMVWPKDDLLAILLPTLNLSRCKLSPLLHKNILGRPENK